MKANKFFTLATLALQIFLASSCSKDDDKDYQTDNTTTVNKKTKESGEKFLDENKTKESVEETFSGLQYIIAIEGKGISPSLEDSVLISYKGMTTDNSTFCDVKSEKVMVGDQTKGFQEALTMMKEGSSYKLFIPYYLSYGSMSRTYLYNSKQVTIKPYSVLVYEITLEKVIQNKEP